MPSQLFANHNALGPPRFSILIFEPPSMRVCSSTPPKQNQDFVKEHNEDPFKEQFGKRDIQTLIEIIWQMHSSSSASWEINKCN